MELGDRSASGKARRRCQLSRAPAGLALGRLKLMTGCGSGSPSIEPEDRRLAGVELTRSLKCRTAALDPKLPLVQALGFARRLPGPARPGQAVPRAGLVAVCPVAAGKMMA